MFADRLVIKKLCEPHLKFQMLAFSINHNRETLAKNEKRNKNWQYQKKIEEWELLKIFNKRQKNLSFMFIQQNQINAIG